ncbi:hypothetical protein Tco_0784450, partial [Tanacetum coccineum]
MLWHQNSKTMVGTRILEECPKNIGSGEAKNLKKPSQTPRVENDVDLGTNGGTSNLTNKKANSSGSSFWNMESSPSTTPIVEKFDKMEKLIIDEMSTLGDDEGLPFTRIYSFGDHDSDDEVASVDNNMANFLASKAVGY